MGRKALLIAQVGHRGLYEECRAGAEPDSKALRFLKGTVCDGRKLALR
jgi:hypothetical protein